MDTGAGGAGGGEDDASSRASSPTKSPLGLGSSPFLDAQDQPLARQPPGARAGRASQQGLGSGQGQGPFDAAEQQQQRMRPPSPLGRRPGLPNWQELAEQEGLAPGDPAAAAGLSGRRGGTPPARMFGSAPGGAPSGGGLFGAAPGGGASAGGLPRGLFGNSAAPSDPVTYQMQAALDKDGVPNLGEVQDEQPGAPALNSPLAHPGLQQQAQQPQWHIPAVHTHGATPGSSSRPRRAGGGPGTPGVSQGAGKRGLLDKPKPGAAFKLGKRAAYTKYLAYEVGACTAAATAARWDGVCPAAWRRPGGQGVLLAGCAPRPARRLPQWPPLSHRHVVHTLPSCRPPRPPRLAGLLAAVPGGAAGGQQPHGRHLPDGWLRRAEEGAGPGPALPHPVRQRPLALHPGRHAVHLVRAERRRWRSRGGQGQRRLLFVKWVDACGERAMFSAT